MLTLAADSVRLLVFCPYFPPHVGGVESFCSELHDVLQRQDPGLAITVLAPRLPTEAPEEEHRAPGYRVLRYPAFEVVPNFPVPKVWTHAFWHAARTARPRSHDVLVSHTRFFLASGLALVCGRLTRRPLLHIEHGSDYVQLGSRTTRSLARAYDRTLGRQVLRRADGLVAVSDASARFVEELAGRRPPVIRRGFWPHRLGALRPDSGVTDFAAGRAIVLYVGRLISGKGVTDLLAAFAAVPGTGAVLCIVGDGPERERLAARAHTLGLGGRVLFTGLVSEAQALASMLAADIVVNPSLTEGLPTTVLEAAMLGRAIVATDVGGTSEILDHEQTGLLVPPHDPSILAAALTHLLADPVLRRELGDAARTAAHQRFDWERSAVRFRAAVLALTDGTG